MTRPGQAIGVLGGSFDPPHPGHVHITREALRRFGLDQVWWMVSPGNPLKARGPAPMAQRLEACRQTIRHPRVHVSDFEAQAGTRYTAETLQRLITLRPRVRFVWLMGADNLMQFHLWQDWRWIIEAVPIGVLARPGDRAAARMSRAAKVYSDYRIRGRHSQLLARGPAPRWCFVNVPMMDVSSSKLRAGGHWAAADGQPSSGGV